MTNEVAPNLVNLQTAVDAALAKLDEADFAARLWKKDASLYTTDAVVQTSLTALLGWLDLPTGMKSAVPDLLALAQSVKDEGFSQVMLVAIDESSLPVVALEQALGRVSGFPELTIVNREGEFLGHTPPNPPGPAKTLFVISAAAEDMLMMPGIAVLYDRVRQIRGDKAGENFIAITQSGTALDRFARELRFREIFFNQAGISGPYLALSYSGLVPAALAGYNIEEMLGRAAIMAEECRKPGLENPGLHLGSIIGAASYPNRPGMSLALPQPFESFGVWADRLLYSTIGRGIQPLEGALSSRDVGGRLIVSLQLSNQRDLPTERNLKKLEDTAHPVVRLRLKDYAGLSAEFFRWQFAAMVAGVLPVFDNPVPEQ